jgi:hypothetical protein
MGDPLVVSLPFAAALPGRPADPQASDNAVVKYPGLFARGLF